MRTYERHELAQGQLKPLPEGLPKTHVEIIAEGETPIVTPPDERSKLTIEQVEAAERIRAREEARPIEEEIPALDRIATAVEELDKKPKFTDEELQAIADGSGNPAVFVADDLQERLDRIVQWANAYPLEIFPKPDLKLARKLLEDGGMTLDGVSADAMRHVLEGIKKIALGEDRT